MDVRPTILRVTQLLRDVPGAILYGLGARSRRDEGTGFRTVEPNRVRDRLAQLFVHREFIFRANGRVQCFKLSSRLQKVVAGGSVVALSWMLYFSVSTYALNASLADRDRQYTDAQRALEGSLSELGGRQGSSEGLQWLRFGDDADLPQTVEALQQQIRKLLDRTERLETEVATTIGKLAETTSKNVRLAHDRDTERLRAEALARRLSEMNESQSAILEQIREQTTAGMRTVENLLADAGFDLKPVLEKLVAEADPREQGGLQISQNTDRSIDAAFDAQSTLLLFDREIARWQGLRRLVLSLPLTEPMRKFRITSGFGLRKDPITGVTAFHNGIDLAARVGTPVIAPASGVVRRAGRYSSYGRMVEIDHGNGVRSRYGHLNKILVERGQSVIAGYQIGQVGNTGRSTGPHLHYEVLINGKPLDPLALLAARQELFEVAQLGALQQSASGR